MSTASRPDLDAAADFLWRNARLLDRHRFAYLTGAAAAAPVVATLRAYANADGGFGNGLEPDIRAPVSQPQPLELALRVLDEVEAFDDPLVTGACDWLATVTTAEGGVPFVLPSVREWPRAPWWQSDDAPPASVNPTAPIAGLLTRNGVAHPWLRGASAFVWRTLEGSRDSFGSLGGYEAIALFAFLDGVRGLDPARAEAAAERLGRVVAERGIVALDPRAEGHVFTPLALAPRPDSLARTQFADGVVDAHLDALAAGQQDDGGWPIGWEPPSVAAALEWRGWITVGALRTLRAYGRI